ncbi:hypothetical protein E2C01_045584 [Portunus trituberculatus]|uniref:Uncharacterized protein n=1 Tax=Portunus trituberculatus TaxID=210409 RepID=A0A5B7FYP7_PORTR|nr:hypothetical protein [Portunus trituberculatus]
MSSEVKKRSGQCLLPESVLKGGRSGRTGRREGRLDEAGTKARFLGRVCSRTKNVSVRSLRSRPSRRTELQGKGRLSAKIVESIHITDKDTVS